MRWFTHNGTWGQVDEGIQSTQTQKHRQTLLTHFLSGRKRNIGRTEQGWNSLFMLSKKRKKEEEMHSVCVCDKRDIYWIWYIKQDPSWVQGTQKTLEDREDSTVSSFLQKSFSSSQKGWRGSLWSVSERHIYSSALTSCVDGWNPAEAQRPAAHQHDDV